MTRLIAIVLLLAIAFLLIRYRTNARLQKGVVITIFSALILYTVSVVIMELFR
ncbi:hypothetical protein [Vibrio eleionomae]|uniref:hypothetical protein n=1 Tax=Vibrio eleionomae TaxID=2653505 RepID=UPI001927DB98|nr:hypothetical protein [Vibrio eleionomae]